MRTTWQSNKRCNVNATSEPNKEVVAPAQLLCLFENPMEGLHAVLHTCHTTSFGQYGIFGTLWQLEHDRDGAPNLEIVSVDCIVDHCLLVPQNPSENLWLEV